MTADPLARLQPTVAAILRSHEVPGALLAAAPAAGPVFTLAVGVDGAGRPLTVDSLFPVASITKLATALVILRLFDAGALGLDDPLGRHLPEAAAAQPGLTLRTLLTHTSGLSSADQRALAPWTDGLTWPALAAASLRVAPRRPPDQLVEYGDLNYDLLGLVVERLTGQPFAVSVQLLVLEPLGIEGYLGVEPPRPPAVIAGVAVAAPGTPLAWINTATFRAVGAPSSGLLTTVAGALALVRAFQGQPPGFLAPDWRAAARRDQTGGLSGRLAGIDYARLPWGLGPTLLGQRRPHWTPPGTSADSFGQVGTSGGIVWGEPRSGLAWAILCPRALAAAWSFETLAAIGAAIRDALAA